VSGRGRRSNRAYRDINLESAARTLGISASYLGRILYGQKRPSLEIAGRIGGLFGWSLDQVNSLFKPSLKSSQSQ
jgi:transcriptional regulator with XRE-family HTH domain